VLFRSGEEEILVDVYRKLLADVPGLRMVVAPRYVERSGKIVSIAQGAGLSARLRSAGAAAGPARVVVLDTIGELAAAYRLATLAFVGGSFGRRGGQNVLEPAGQGKPVLFGPNMESFKDSVQVLVGRGGIQVATPEQLLKVARELLSRPEEILRLGAMAREAVGAVRGASARNVDHMLRAIPRGKDAA
jgi:3-deoxy-D-manno-octulosonic-acid transferase